jgi:hypothetical protein
MRHDSTRPNTRDERTQRGERGPAAAERPEDGERGVGMGSHAARLVGVDDGGQARTKRLRQRGRRGLALQRRESEAAGGVEVEQPLHGGVAERAAPVEEDDTFDRRHGDDSGQREHVLATRLPASTPDG